MSKQQQNSGSPLGASDPQPGQTPDFFGQVEEPEPTSYLTMEQFQAYQKQMEQRLSETENKAFSRAQSFYDKSNARVRAEMSRLDEYFTAMQEAGTEVPRDVQAQLKDKARNRIQEQGMEEGFEHYENNQGGNRQQQQRHNPTVDPMEQAVNALAVSLEKAFGVSIADNDPEAGNIVTNGTPDEFYSSYVQALQAKAARTNQPQAPGARIAGVTQGRATPDRATQITQRLQQLEPTIASNHEHFKEYQSLNNELAALHK